MDGTPRRKHNCQDDDQESTSFFTGASDFGIEKYQSYSSGRDLKTTNTVTHVTNVYNFYHLLPSSPASHRLPASRSFTPPFQLPIHDPQPQLASSRYSSTSKGATSRDTNLAHGHNPPFHSTLFSLPPPPQSTSQGHDPSNRAMATINSYQPSDYSLPLQHPSTSPFPLPQQTNFSEGFYSAAPNANDPFGYHDPFQFAFTSPFPPTPPAPNINHNNGRVGQGAAPVHTHHTYHGYYPPAALDQPTVPGDPGPAPVLQIGRPASPQAHAFESVSSVRESFVVPTDHSFPLPMELPGALSSTHRDGSPDSNTFYMDVDSPRSPEGSSGSDVEMEGELDWLTGPQSLSLKWVPSSCSLPRHSLGMNPLSLSSSSSYRPLPKPPISWQSSFASTMVPNTNTYVPCASSPPLPAISSSPRAKMPMFSLKRHRREVVVRHKLLHASVVCCVNFSSDGRYLATGSSRRAHIYDSWTGLKIHTLNTSRQANVYVRSVCFSPCGKWLATGGEDRVVKIWDISKRAIRCTLDGHQQEINSVKFSRDGRLLVSGSSDGTSRIWDISEVTVPSTTSQLSAEEQKEKAEPIVLDVLGSRPNEDTNETDDQPDGSRPKAITSIAISPNGQYVAAGCLNHNIYLWDLSQTSSLSGRTQPPIRVECIEGHENSVYSVSFSKDGRFLVSASLDKTVKVWDVSDLEYVGILPQEPKSNPPHPTPLSVPGGNTGPGPRCVKEFVGHEDYILSAAASPDGRLIASGGRDRTVRFWHFGDHALEEPTLPTTPPVLKERKTAYILSQAHQNTVVSVDFSPSGNMLATASGDRTVKIWRYGAF